MKTLSLRRVIILLACAATAGSSARADEAAAKPPPVQEIVRDGDGQVWGISLRRDTGVYRLVDERWRPAPVTGLPEKDCRPAGLTRRADGAAVCLWSAAGGERFFSVHRGAQTEPSKAIAVTVPQPGTETPRLFADTKNNVWLTGGSPDICLLSSEGTATCAHVIQPEDCFVVGRTGPSDTRITGWNEVAAWEDAQGRVWFRAVSSTISHASLRGVLIYDGGNFSLHDVVQPGEQHRPIVALAQKDAGHLWAGLSYDGLYTLDTASFQLARVPGQPEESRYRQEIFARGDDWYFVFHGYYAMLGSSLWRLHDGAWSKLIGAVDTTASTYRRTRLWVRTDGGNYLGSTGNGLWYVPDEGAPRAVNWQQGFPLSEPLQLIPLAGDGRWLAVDWEGQGWIGQPDALLKRTSPETAPRVTYVRTAHEFVADSRRHLWGLRSFDDKTLGEWDGEKWISHDLPVDRLAGTWLRRPMGVDGKQRVWLLDVAPRRRTTLIYDPTQDHWDLFDSFEKALEAQASLGQAAELLVTDNTEDLARFGPNGQVCYLNDRTTIGWFDGKNWRHWRRNEVKGPEARYAFEGPPFFTVDGTLAINIFKATWVWAGESGWMRAATYQPGYADYQVRSQANHRPTPPPGAVTRNPRSIVLDNEGLCWLTWENQLYRCRDDLCAPVFAPGEAQPFIDGRQLDSVLLDARGNAFLRSTERREYAVLASPGPPPRTSVALAPAAGPDAPEDTRIVQLSSDAAPIEGKVRFTWRLDDGAWQPLAVDAPPASVTLTALRAGPHRFEARSFDPALRADATPAALPIEIQIDEGGRVAGYIAQLADPDYARRQQAVAGLARLPELALPALRAARAGADENLRWWIDAALQELEKAKSATPGKTGGGRAAGSAQE